MKSFKIRVSNEDESLRVQEELFRRGYDWPNGKKQPQATKEAFLFFSKIELMTKHLP